MRRAAQVRRYLTAFDTTRLPQVFTDVVVVGGGVAALRACIEMAPTLQITVLLKDRTSDSNSYHAQGGIAAAVSPEDSIESHIADTLAAGCGLSDPQVVRRVVAAAPDCNRELVKWGAVFDSAGGALSAGREGGHSAARIIHARGDATGKEITTTLLRRARTFDTIDLREDTFAVDLLSVGRTVVGVLARHPKQGLFVVRAKRTILATGGIGHMYRETTNPDGATGDGLAMAYRAGATLADLEFVQFHPTTLYIAGASRHLISETVRGEGGRLVDKAGRPFMHEYHPQGDLAPRDVVSRAIVGHLRRSGETHVFLDLAPLGHEARKRFPGIAKACAQFGIDIAKDRIPVRPAAHYMVGGVKADRAGRTSLERLYACGEVSSTGLHGANRLGSNSLLEGLVYGREAGRRIVEELSAAAAPASAAAAREVPERIRSDVTRSTRGELNLPDVRNSLRSLLWRNVGIVRSAEDLAEADALIEFWQSYVLDKVFDQPAGWELQNMLALGRLMAHAALVRTETRGVHFRSDYPERDDEHWRRHILMARDQELRIE